MAKAPNRAEALRRGPVKRAFSQEISCKARRPVRRLDRAGGDIWQKVAELNGLDGKVSIRESFRKSGRWLFCIIIIVDYVIGWIFYECCNL